jgi:hypothetical protein
MLSDGARSRLHETNLRTCADYRPVFVEEARVLRPGGVAIHRFSHGLCFVEPHTKVPVAPLTKSSAYLATWAMLGLRNTRQNGLGWRETLASNKRLLATMNYVSRRTILRAAMNLGFDAGFDDFLSISYGRAGRLYRAAESIGAGGIAEVVLCHAQDNRILLLRKCVEALSLS